MFADNLKTLIGKRSVSSVAREIGLLQQTLQRYANCESEIKLDNLIKIADYFDEDIDWLISLKNMPRAISR